MAIIAAHVDVRPRKKPPRKAVAGIDKTLRSLAEAMHSPLRKSIPEAPPLRRESGTLRVGVDIVEIERLRGVVERWGERFLRRIYTTGELEYCRGRAPQLAARFAAKEAMMKALGTGRRGVDWRNIEVVRCRGGRPSIQLQGRASKVAGRLAVSQIALSLSHSREYAVASVLVETREAL